MAAAAQAAGRADFDRFVQWLHGEWNNHEQVWQQKGKLKPGETLAADERIPHVHHIFSRVPMPQLGEHIFYVQQALAEKLDSPYRQRLYRLAQNPVEQAIRMEIFGLPDEAEWRDAQAAPQRFSALDANRLKAFPGCEIFWRYDESSAAFTGKLKSGQCSVFSTRLNKKIFITDTLRLSASEIWINDQATDEAGARVFGSKTDTPVKSRKVRYFDGWVVINRNGKEAEPKEGAFSVRRDLRLHNEGAVAPIRLDDGSLTPFDVQLAQLTYQRTGVPILKLAVLDRASGKSLFYTWASTDASRIGLNLGWVQIGLTQKAANPAFRLDPAGS